MKKGICLLTKSIEALLIAMMSLMVLVVFLATVGRYTGGFSIPWSEECARYLMIAIVYLGLMLASLQDRHFVVEIVPLVFRNHPQAIKFSRIFATLLLDIFAVYLFYYGTNVVEKMLAQGKLSPMLKIPLGYIYFLIPLGIALMAVFQTYRTLQKTFLPESSTAEVIEKESGVHSK